MAKQEKLKHLMPIVTTIGLGVAYLWTLADFKRRDRKAFDDYLSVAKIPEFRVNEARRVWMDACKWTRRDRDEVYEEKERLEDILDIVDEFVEVSHGLKAAHHLLFDKDVPAMVRVSIFKHWLGRWATLFNVSIPAEPGDLDDLLEAAGLQSRGSK